MKKELRVFPDDWSMLPDDVVLENLKYIKKHYWRYEHTSPDLLELHVGNVVFSQNDPMTPLFCMNVNNRILCSANKESYDIASKIFTFGMNEIRELSRGAKIIGPLVKIVGSAVIVAGFVGGAIFGNNIGKKMVEKKKAEWAKEVLDSYHQEKIKTDAVNIDSLINQHVR